MSEEGQLTVDEVISAFGDGQPRRPRCPRKDALRHGRRVFQDGSLHHLAEPDMPFEISCSVASGGSRLCFSHALMCALRSRSRRSVQNPYSSQLTRPCHNIAEDPSI
jgi:hypothetical protein